MPASRISGAYAVIEKAPSGWTVPPNLADYDQAVRGFSWRRARQRSAEIGLVEAELRR